MFRSGNNMFRSGNTCLDPGITCLDLGIKCLDPWIKCLDLGISSSPGDGKNSEDEDTLPVKDMCPIWRKTRKRKGSWDVYFSFFFADYFLLCPRQKRKECEFLSE